MAFTAEQIDGERLHTFGLVNPCGYFSKGAYPATGGHPPCTIKIPHHDAFATAAKGEGLTALEYIETHLDSPNFFTLHCSCPGHHYRDDDHV